MVDAFVVTADAFSRQAFHVVESVAFMSVSLSNR